MDTQLAGIIWLVVLLSLGFLNCYFGYRLFIITVGIVGFLLAGSFGYIIGDWLGSNLIALVLVLIFGLIGSWASVMAFYAFIFIIGGFGFALLTVFILGLRNESVSIIFPLVAALIGGFLALWLQRIIIIIATASQGSLSSVLATFALVSGGGTVAYRRFLNNFLDGDLSRTGGIWFYLGILLWLILFISGLTTQFLRGKEMYRRSKPAAIEPAD
jgi:hypothetical protein